MTFIEKLISKVKRYLKKRRVIKKLRKTLKKLRDLPDSKFNYRNLVSEFDLKNECGTVCCVAGWYPKWFPEVGLRWEIREQCINLVCTEDHFAHPRSANGSLNPINTIRGVLRKYHEVNKNVEGALFFGLLIKTKDGSLKIRAHRGFSSTKEQIDTLWEQIIDAIKREKIDWE